MAAGLNKALLGVPVVVLIVLAVFAATPFLATCGGHDEVVTAAVLRCPRAVELLGDDAHPARLGMACGNTKTSGSTGSASWAMPYTGSRGRGTISFVAYKNRGDWQLDDAVLEIGDHKIDLLACSGETPAGGRSSGDRSSGDRSSRGPSSSGGGIVQTNADAASASFDGKVIRSNHPTILSGSTCSGTFKRERGATMAHATVTCRAGIGESGGGAPSSEIAIYAGDGKFSMEVGDPSRRDDDRSELEDAKTSDEDQTPGCRLSSAGNSGTLTIWDTNPAYEIVVEL